jgi:hypothetical protein
VIPELPLHAEGEVWVCHAHRMIGTREAAEALYGLDEHGDPMMVFANTVTVWRRGEVDTVPFRDGVTGQQFRVRWQDVVAIDPQEAIVRGREQAALAESYEPEANT